jgi:shikimate kinase
MLKIELINKPIYLIGYMCSGKTTIAKKLSKEYNIPYVDLDKYIEEKYSMSINKIFEIFGEDYFRKIESSALKEISTNKNIIISTGGGTPCYFDNMKYMNNTGTTIYVYCEKEILLDRLFKYKKSRPLLKDKSKEEIKTFFEKSFKNREKTYKLCDKTINNSN